MNLETLTGILYAEHKREKKISIRNYILVAILTLAAVLAIIDLTSSTSVFSERIMAVISKIPGGKIPYIKMIALVMLLCAFISPTMVLFTSLKRPKIIEEILNLFKQNKYGDNFWDQKVFKTSIPLLKLNLKLSPFNYLHFTLNGKAYKLPVPLDAMSDIRSTLSGANMDKVYSVWNELYTDEKSNEIEKNTPLKSLEGLKYLHRKL